MSNLQTTLIDTNSVPIDDSHQTMNSTLDVFFRALGMSHGISISINTTIVSVLAFHMKRPNASKTLFGATIPYSTDFMDHLLQNGSQKYVSEETAVAMASKARGKNIDCLLERTGDLHSLIDFIGIGVTAAIRSEEPKKGLHHVFVACITNSKLFVFYLIMRKNERSRAEEDEVASYLAVIAIQKAVGLPLLPPELFLKPMETIEVIRETDHPDPLDCLLDDIGTNSVLFVNGKFVARNVKFPEGTIVYPGSFNPIHNGHTSLMIAALEHVGGSCIILIEISIGNVDKSTITIKDCYSRLRQIGVFLDKTDLKNVGVIFTKQSTFKGKSTLFQKCHFLIGYDTLVRILDATYLIDGDTMLSMLCSILYRNGCRFVIGGRHAIQNDGSSEFQVVTDGYIEEKLSCSILNLPAKAFDALTEDEFCVCESSRNIRATLTSESI